MQKCARIRLHYALFTQYKVLNMLAIYVHVNLTKQIHSNYVLGNLPSKEAIQTLFFTSLTLF